MLNDVKKQINFLEPQKCDHIDRKLSGTDKMKWAKKSKNKMIINQFK